MTVKQLIAKLQKLPQNLPVFISDHDHGEFEVNARVNEVNIVDKSGVNNIADYGFCNSRDQVTEEHLRRWEDTPKKYVVVRP